VVIGGTSGIGRTLAMGLARGGANVVATGRREERVRSVTGEIEKLGRKSLAQITDITSRESLQNLQHAVAAKFDNVDVLVNCAGKTKRTPTLRVDDDEWSDILETNLTGTLRACQIFGAPMVERQRGSIINIASLSSFLGWFEVSAYAASKAAVASLTRNLAVEWAMSNVRVNAIAPGNFRTDLNAALLDGTARGQEFLTRTPMKRWGKLEELVGAAVFLASDASSYITGQILAVDGGFLASGVNQ
jgi:NAD(P)-dependent dehydrogenase (short-subunit alcohol dehydrogenase family)